LCYTILNCYYRGAMTMFFSARVNMPFNSIHDVIRAYPDWHLLHVKGAEALYQFMARAGDKDYQTYWNRYLDFPDEVTVQNVEEGMNKVLNSPSVLHTTLAGFRGHFK